MVTKTQGPVSDMNPLHQYILYTNHHQDHHNLHHVLHYWASSQQHWHWYRISSGSVKTDLSSADTNINYRAKGQVEP